MSEGGRFTAEKVVSSATEPLFNGPVSGVWGGGAVLPGGGGALLHSGSIWKRRPPVTVGIFQQQVSLCVWIEGEAGGGGISGGGGYLKEEVDFCSAFCPLLKDSWFWYWNQGSSEY